MLERELSAEYLSEVRGHLERLAFKRGMLMRAVLGESNEGTDYVLLRPARDDRNWLRRLVARTLAAWSFTLDPRDEAGSNALGGIRDLGVNPVANVLAQSVEHVDRFLQRLRVELAFYVAAINLHERLRSLGPTCFPGPTEGRCRAFHRLGDASLALSSGRAVVGNDADATGKNLIIVTGANRGGKSTLLRSVGLAQLMLQAGLFVSAESYAAGVCTGIFTHAKREEDASLVSGKLDEELARASAIVDHIRPGALLLLNESFAATNERQGAEIARQIVDALVERGVGIVYVTHNYDFAHRYHERRARDVLFLRAERRDDGTRTFKLVPGAPEATSYAEDLYAKVFGASQG